MNVRDVAGPSVPDAAKEGIGFLRWIDRFRKRARASGIRDGVFDVAFRGVRFNAEVIQKDRRQPEFTRQIWNYLDALVSDARVRDGRAALHRNRRLFAEIEARFDVEACNPGSRLGSRERLRRLLRRHVRDRGAGNAGL